MNNIVTWGEIPVTDMARAKAFFADVVGVSFVDQNTDDFKMAMFESSSPTAASGALVQAEGYVPSKHSSTIYLWGGDDLTHALERAQAHGSDIVCPKTPINGGEDGYFAQFIDCEGNRVGLYSLG